MFDKYRTTQHEVYNKARKHFIASPNQLIELERYVSDVLFVSLQKHLTDIEKDYDEASNLFPFWQNYPPIERGRKPKGDQYPWIEVGEHAVGDKLLLALEDEFEIRSVGMPTGPDERYVIKSKRIAKITEGLTDSVWIITDIKSVGPRDDHAHAVMSPYQVSGTGDWDNVQEGLKNKVMTAQGLRSKHPFHSALAPIYVLADQTILPVTNFVLKPVYKMLSLENPETKGQPLSRIDLISIPNGLLLEENPAYLKKHPGLLFPGKDDKKKNPLKVRARIDFRILQLIDDWRVRELSVK